MKLSHRIAAFTAIARREVEYLTAIAEKRAAKAVGTRAVPSSQPLSAGEAETI